MKPMQIARDIGFRIRFLMPRIRWTEKSRRDLLEIGRFIALDKLGAARNWVARLQQRALQAAEFPE